MEVESVVEKMPESTVRRWENIKGLVFKRKFFPREFKIVDRGARWVQYDLTDIIPKEFDEIEIYQVTDVQYGTRTCDKSLFHNYRDFILARENRLALWTGDMVNLNTKISLGSTFEEEGDPQSVIWSFVEEAAPMAHRVLSYVGGNHERRTEATFGDAGITISTLLGIPYSPGKQHIDIEFGSWKNFKITQFHGATGGSTNSSVASSLTKLMQQGDSHLYTMGHLHTPQIVTDCREERNYQTRDINMVTVCAGMSSSFLDYYGSYGETRGFRAKATGFLRTIVRRDMTWEVTITPKF
jgi:predicted phosphodiesterase